MNTERIEKLKALQEISAAVKPLVESGEFTNVNQAIIETVYKSEQHNEFKSLKQWNKDGFKIKKGEHAFAVWGKPIEQEDADEKEPKFYPISYIFSNSQVIQAK